MNPIMRQLQGALSELSETAKNESSYYHAAREEHERCRVKARSRIEANQRAIEQVRNRKSGIEELIQKLFEQVRIIVQKRIERYQEKLQNNRGKGI